MLKSAHNYTENVLRTQAVLDTAGLVTDADCAR